MKYKYFIQARYEFRIKRAGYVRNIKNAVMNVFGKVFLGNYPGNKATPMEIANWKNSKNVKWASENLWNPVENSNDLHDTYINRITNEVLKKSERAENNCLFVVAIVDLIFDPEIQTTTLSGELITKRMDQMEKDKESYEDDTDENDQEDDQEDDQTDDRDADTS